MNSSFHRFVATLVLMFLMLWGATANWGRKQVRDDVIGWVRGYPSNRSLPMSSSVPFNPSEKQRHPARYVAVSDGVAVFPCIVRIEGGFGGDQMGYSERTYHVWFFGLRTPIRRGMWYQWSSH